jgi:hypothetical protein
MLTTLIEVIQLIIKKEFDMNILTNFDVGFFNTVQYDLNVEDDSFISQLEAVADVCRAPSRWVAAEFWEGGKTYSIKNVKEEEVDLACNDTPSKSTQGMQKAIRVFAGAILSLPGQALALAFMAAAYTNEEIRLKHTMSVRTLSDEEKEKLADLIQKRQELAKERQGCEPVSCLLFSICCLLCCLVCQK